MEGYPLKQLITVTKSRFQSHLKFINNLIPHTYHFKMNDKKCKHFYVNYMGSEKN